MVKELILRAQAGDAAALSEIYEKMYKRVYYLALRMTNSPEDAEDAAQETFISAFNSIGNLENPEAFESWLLQICSNRCRNLKRKNARTVDLVEDEDGNTVLDELVDPNESLIPETALQDEAQRRLIMDTVKALPQNQKECVLMFYFSGIGVKEIAQELGCSEGTVKSRLNYARQKIKESILAIEKRDGIRLHSFAPLALLLATDMDAITANLTLPALGGITAGAAALGGAGAAAGASAGAAAGGSSGAAAATGAKVAAGVALKTKIIAGVAAAAVAVGGGTAVYHAVQDREPSPYVEFVDAGMEHNMHILLDIPEDEPILKETLAEIDALFFVEDGMNLLSDDFAVGYITEYGDFSETETPYSSPLYSVEQVRPAEGTVPVENLSDLQYFGDEALHIACLDAQTQADPENIAELFPDTLVRAQPSNGLMLPFMGSIYWNESGEVQINSQADLDRLNTFVLIRDPEYVEFVDANMEHSIHTLLEIPTDAPISSYEMQQLSQIEFYNGQVSLFLSDFHSGTWTANALNEQTRMPERFDDLQLFSEHFLVVSLPYENYIDEQIILNVRPDAQFHYFFG